MHRKSLAAALVLFGFLPAGPASAQLADNEEEFQQMVAALKADDAERQGAIDICIEQGVNSNPEPARIARFMGVPVAQAWEAWCTRTTNGIANGKLMLADVNALNEGTFTPAAQDVLTTVSEGK
jgi:hypothetical protein